MEENKEFQIDGQALPAEQKEREQTDKEQKLTDKERERTDGEQIDREQLKKELLRKAAHRKFALETYDQLSFIDSDNPLSEKESYRKLKSNLIDAKELAFQDGYFAIISKRKGIGKLEVFWKKAVRKLFKIFYGWYIFPIYKRQTNYNELMVSNLHLMREILEEQQEEIASLKEELRILRGGEKEEQK